MSGPGWDPSPRSHEQYRERRFPLIDNDPHFSRVVSYFRGYDYATWAGVTAAFPVGFVAIERLLPHHRFSRRPPPTLYNLRLPLISSVFLGAWAGFLIAYTQSSFRFMGLTENKREYERDHTELSTRIKKGLLPYGEPTKGPESALRAGHYNSMNSQFNLVAVPWFNLANHPWHGRDMDDYSKPCDWQTAFQQANEKAALAL